MKTALFAMVLATAACGGTSSPASTETGPARASSGPPPAVAKFHDTLAPRWHAEHGPKRIADTCAALPAFHADADAIATAEPPAGGDAAAWSAGGKQLVDAVAALDATCQANDAVAFEPAFERVHNAFHGVMAAAGGEHGTGEHGKDEHSEHH